MHYTQVLAELDKVRAEGGITKRKMAELHAGFGARFTAAWKLVKEGRVKKYVFQPSGRVQWIVVGKGGDYLIYELSGYCHCIDYFTSIMDGKAKTCKHLIAQRLACSLGLYTVVEEKDENYERLMEEWARTSLK